MSDLPVSSLNLLKQPKKLIGLAILGFLLIQITTFIIPLFKHTNPPVTQTINWDSPQTEQLIRQSCLDCHSNESTWPWYSFVAPVSWLVGKDVHEGRDNLNFSTDTNLEIDEILKVIREGEMPPQIYTVMHGDAKLSDEERQQLITGITNTFSASEQGLSSGSGDDEDRDDDDD